MKATLVLPQSSPSVDEILCPHASLILLSRNWLLVSLAMIPEASSFHVSAHEVDEYPAVLLTATKKREEINSHFKLSIPSTNCLQHKFITSLFHVSVNVFR